MKTHNSYHEPGDVVLATWQEQLKQAQEKPWLASLLLRQGERILRRFAYFYERLRALPRTTRRTIQKKLATTLAGAALLLALNGTPSVHAANIAVTPGATGINSGDGCSLVEAIINANHDAATHAECTAGSGADVITLAGNTYSYTSAYSGGSNALPVIGSAITIDANNATIQGNNTFRILEVNDTGALTLNNATITGGSASTVGGGISSKGPTIVNNSTISGNSANYGGGIYEGFSSLTVNNSTISGNSATGYGGAIVGNYVDITIANSTITGNSAPGIRARTNLEFMNTFSVQHSVVSGNSGGEISLTFADETINTDYNLFGDSSTTNASAFVGFTPGSSDMTATNDGTEPTPLANILDSTLANNGTQPHTFTHALVNGSPAIDAVPVGEPGCNIDGSSTDQRGGARANTTYGSGVYCDIGAFEYGASNTPTALTIEGLTAHNHGKAAPLAGATGVLALFTGGWLTHVRRRKA